MRNHNTKRRDPRRYGPSGALAILTLAAVACGSDGTATPSAATTTPPTTTTSPEEPDASDPFEPAQTQPASTPVPTEPPPQETSFGLVLSFKDPPAGEGGDGAEISGTLEIDQEGCLLIQPLQSDPGGPYPPTPVLWPFGTTWNAEPPGVMLSSGRVIEIGDHVSAAGGYSRADTVLRLVGDDAADIVERCDVPGSEFAIINNSDNQIE